MTVIGGGASALDVVASLHDVGAEVRLIVANRRSALTDWGPAAGGGKLGIPTSGLGGGWHNQFFEHGPSLFRHLPEVRAPWI